MKQKIMITGDRQHSLIYPGLVAVEMIRALAADKQVITGVNDGVEHFVRSLAEAAGLEVEKINQPGLLENDKPDWDERHALLVAQEIEVVAIHTDPHSSSIIRSLSRVCPDDTLRIVTPADLLV